MIGILASFLSRDREVPGDAGRGATSSAGCGGNSARRGGSPTGRFVRSLQRVPMLVCLLIELKNVVAVAVGCFRTRPLRF